MIRRSGRLPLFLLALLILVGAAAPTPTFGRQGKVPLTHDVYDSWRTIRGATLSDDGDWLMYAEVPQDGDAELVVRGLESGVEHRHGIGYLTADNPFVSSIDAEFSPGGGHVVFLVFPDKAEIEESEESEGDDEPRKSLAVLDLSDGAVDTISGVKSFAMPADAGDWVAYLMEEPLEAVAEGEVDGAEAEPEPEAGPGAATGEEENAEEDDEKEKDYGTELRLRWLASGSEVHETSVLEYHPVADGSQLLYAVSSEEAPAIDGVYALATDSRESRALLTGEGNYVRLSFAEEADRYAFLTDTNDYAAAEPVFELYGGEVDGDAAELWVSHRSTDGFPGGMAVSDKEGVSISDDGAVVMFGIRPLPEPEEDEEESDDERARFDLWHWQDPYPQPQQLLVAGQVRDETFESVWWVEEGRFVQLADEALPDVTLSDDGRVAMGTSDLRWSDRHSYEGFFNDVFVVDAATGERTLVAERVSWGAELSPGGAWISWFGGDGEWVGYDRNGEGGFADGQDWFLHDVAAGTTRNLTEDFELPVERHDWDTPNLPAPYGGAGFAADDSAVLIYDRYDLWSFPTGGGEPVRVTDGVGRDADTSFRLVRTDPDERGVPVDRPILLSSTHEETMATGFWVDTLSGPGDPLRLLGADADLSFVDLADDAGTMAFTRQTFSEFPDVWVGELDMEAGTLGDVRKVTDLGAQTEPYLWGEAELREFRSSDGLPLKGILIKPENFDPSREYPLMVYIYETLHTRYHSFSNPSPGTSINFAYYASNDYVIWMPDIEYATPGYPGKDALKCVLPGINMLLDEGFVDPEAIGIQGHSWGGYQIAYMLTQTDVFAAAESGAPVSNMTSAYGGIRWGSGLVRQFQYERTQSRLGASLWEVPLRYVENSPLFWADEVDTPVLMLHNDEDGAVPWYQGIEFMMALRRLDKEAYMFNYNGEAHGLRQRVNQEDWTVRMQEFFDHHLRGAEAPAWMTEGIRGWEKGEVDR